MSDSREAAAPGPKASNQHAGMRGVSVDEMIEYNLNNLRNLLREFQSGDPQGGFVMTAIYSLETVRCQRRNPTPSASSS